MDQESLVYKLKNLILARLFLATLFFSVGNVVMNVQSLNFYWAIAIVYFLSIFYGVWLIGGKFLPQLSYIQVSLDSVLVLILVSLTGGVDSLFSILFIFPVMSASIIIHYKFGIFVAIWIGLLYFLTMFGFISKNGSNIISLNDEHLINIYKTQVQVTTIILVSILVASLLRRISQVEEKLQIKENLTLISDMFAQVAHEIRNPLTSIAGTAELLEEKFQNVVGEREKMLLKTITKESDRVTEILENFLEYSNFGEMSLRSVNLKRVLDEIVILFEENAKYQYNFKFDSKYQSKEDVFVSIDENKMKQVFMNIVKNSLEAMPSGGELSINFIKKQKEICILIRDYGKGMDNSMLNRMFTSKFNRKLSGHGLGLAISNQLVQMHNGRIDFKSRKSKGTLIRVFLPVGKSVE